MLEEVEDEEEEQEEIVRECWKRKKVAEVRKEVRRAAEEVRKPHRWLRR